MIMEQLRSGKFIKWVMFIVIATFVGTIFFAWGMDIGGTRFSKTTVAQIGGKKILFNTFNEELVNRYRNERQSEELSSFKMANLRQELFDQMVAQTILEKEIKSLRLKASTDELIAYFRANPPQGIMQNPYFMTDSVFDSTKYFKFLDSPEAYSIPGMAFLENYHSQYTIPTGQLQMLISSAIKVTDLEARDKIRASDEKAEVEYLYLPTEALLASAGTVSEDEISSYYSQNPDSFKTEGLCELEYAALPKRPSAQDEATVKSEIDIVRERLTKGESFEALAVELSDDATAKDSGDLGYIQKGAMVQPFEEVAFALQPNQISEPIRTVFGFHIIKMVDRNDKEGKIRVRHILLKVAPSLETVDALKEKAEAMAEQVKKGEVLSVLAGKEALLYAKTGVFERNAPIPGFESESKYVSGLSHFAFNKEKEADVFENDENVFVFHVMSRFDRGVASQSAVHDKIRNTLLRRKAETLARAKMENVLAQLKGGMSLKALSEADPAVKYSSTAEATREFFLPYLGASSKAVYKAFGLAENALTPVTEAGAGFAVIKLIRKFPLSETDIAGKLPSVRRSLMEQNRYQAYAAWFEGKKSGLEIVNNLDAFYNQ